MANYWVGFNNPDGSLNTEVRCFTNNDSISVTPRSTNGVAGNTFNGRVYNADDTPVTDWAVYDSPTGTTYPSVPAGGRFCIEALTSGAGGMFGFSLEMPERKNQVITFDLPVVLIDDTITLNTTRDAANASRVIVSSTAGLSVGWDVNGSLIPPDTVIAQVISATVLALSKNIATAGSLGNVEYAGAVFATATIDDLYDAIDSPIGADTVYSPKPVTLSATSNSGLTSFTFTSSNTARASITNGNILSYPSSSQTIEPDSVTITASQAGNEEWKPASKSITLDPELTSAVPHVLDIQVASSIGFNQEVPLTVTSSQSLSPIIIRTFPAGVIDFVGAGTQVIDGVAEKIWNASTKAKGLAAGVAQIEAFQSGNETIESASASVSVLVGKQLQTIIFNVPNIVWRPDITVDLTASSSSGLPITFSTSNPLVATFLEGGRLRTYSQGSVELIASQSGNNDFAPALASVEIGIGSRSQVIVFEEFGPQQYGNPNFSPIVYATSGLPLSFVSSNTSVAAVVGGTLVIVGVGSASITANQSGNAFWNAATSVTRTLVVSKGTAIISATVPPSVRVGDVSRVEIFGTSSNQESVVFSVASASASILKIVNEVGKYYLSGLSDSATPGIVVASVPETSRYVASAIRFPVVSGRRTQSLGGDFFYVRKLSDGFVDLNLKASTRLSVSLSVVSGPGTLSGSRVVFNSTGQVLINATQLGNAEFKPATPVTARVVVEQGEQSIRFLPIPSVLVGQQVLLSALASGGSPVVFYSSAPDVVSVTLSGVATGISEGVAFILAVTLGDASYGPAAAVQPLGVGVRRLDSIAVPLLGVADPENFNSTAVATPFTGPTQVVPSAQVKDTETFNSIVASSATPADFLFVPRTLQDEESFDSRVASLAYTGIVFDMRQYPGKGDHDNEFSSPTVSPVFLGASAFVPVAVEADSSDYFSSTPSPASTAESCIGAKYDGKDEFEIYEASPAFVTRGFILYLSGTAGRLLWSHPDLNTEQINGKYVLI